MLCPAPIDGEKNTKTKTKTKRKNSKEVEKNLGPRAWYVFIVNNLLVYFYDLVFCGPASPSMPLLLLLLLI